MREFEIKIPVREYAYEELDSQDRQLVDSAKKATESSYAPYSRFHVGAAILMANNEIVTGSNQENAAYPSGMCAERTAAFWAGARFPGIALKKIAIAARSEADGNESDFQQMPISPCGACRQVLLEYETLYGPIEVILYGSIRTYVFPSVASLLPFCFTEF